MSKEDFIIKTRDFWQQQTGSQVTDEDARQMIENVTGFFELLMKWENSKKGIPQSCPEYDSSGKVRDVSTKGS